MKTRLKISWLVLVLLIIAVAGSAEAQRRPRAADPGAAAPGNVDVRAVAQEALSMDFDTTRIDFGFVSPAQSPFEIKRAMTVTVKANQNWTLNAVAGDDLRSGAGVIPIRQLMWKRQETGYQSFTRTGSAIVAQGNPTPNEGIKLIYDMLLQINWPDQPGNYSVSITYTLSSRP